MENGQESLSIKNRIDREQNRKSLAFEAAGAGSWDWDIETNEIFYDEQWLNLLGYTSDENVVYSSFWEDRIHPDDKPAVLLSLRNHFDNNSPIYKTEHRLLTKNGTYIWVLDTGKIVEWDALKKPKKISGITIDITEKIIDRQIVAQTEDKYRSIFNHLNDGFCRFDFKGTIIEVNQILCDTLGLKEKEILNSNIKLFFNNRIIKYLYRQLNKLLSEQSISFETIVTTNKKKELPVHISAKLITQTGDGIIQALVRDITDQKIYEKKIIEEKNKLNALIEHSPNVIARFGKNLKCLYISQNSKTILGINPDDLIGKKLESDIIPATLISFIENKFKQTFKKGKEINFNISLDNPEGQKFYDIFCVPEEIQLAQNPETIIVTFFDITEKITREKQLIYSKKILENAEQNVHFGSYEYEYYSQSVIWSKETYQIFERDLDLPPPDYNEYISKYVHPEDIEKACALMHMDSSIDNTGFNSVFRIITNSGKIKYVNSVGNIVMGESPEKYIRVSGTIRDITEIKQIEDKLFVERDILQIVIDNIPDALYIKNIQGNFIRCNKAMAEFFGYLNSDELIGKTIYDIFQVDIANEFIEMEQNMLSNGNSTLTSQKEITISNKLLWINHTLISVKDSTNTTTKIIGITRDITEYITAQQVIIDAKDKAEKADKLKSAFLANMSHEIRTPINGILGFASLMEMKEFSRDKEIEYLRIINNSGKLLLNLINDIIDIAKIEAGQLNINYSNVSLPDLFEELSTFYNGEKIRRSKESVEIKVKVPKNKQYDILFTDQLRIKQVINNLFSNALKFTNKGCIEIGYCPTESNLLFFVKDSGIGIEKTECDIIFDRFKQAGKTSDKKEGTGLGLAISKGLVELLGGKIWVESEPNKGSSFYFTLPYSIIDQTNPEIYSTTKVFPKDYIHWDNKVLLLVEDEVVNYMYIKELLNSTGIIIIHASSAEQAIEICKSSVPIHLILMDIRLPGINGFEATQIIKQIRHNVPIVAQTAYAMENERKECIDAGCDQYITKPFDQDLLFEIINDFLIESCKNHLINS